LMMFFFMLDASDRLTGKILPKKCGKAVI